MQIKTVLRQIKDTWRTFSSQGLLRLKKCAKNLLQKTQNQVIPWLKDYLVPRTKKQTCILAQEAWHQMRQALRLVMQQACAAVDGCKRHPFRSVGLLICFVLVCACSAWSLNAVDRASSTAFQDEVSPSFKRLEGQEKSANAAAKSTAENAGQSFSQNLDSLSAWAVEHIFITADAIKDVSASKKAPEVFSLIEWSGESQNGGQEDDGSAADCSAIDNQETSGDNKLDAVSSSVAAMENEGYQVGCFFLNLQTGQGIAYNLDERIYGASTFKGPYAAFLSEHLVEKGDLSASSKSLMDAMVRYSDNAAFSSLRNSFDRAGFSDWVLSCGVDTSIVHDTHFPRYSAREAALLWLHIYTYLETGSDAANHLRDLYEHTNVSFIRDAVEAQASIDETQTDAAETQDTADTETEILDTTTKTSDNTAKSETTSDEMPVVLNKAGWIASSPRFSGLCDAGVIECGDSSYLMTIMTSAPDSGLHRDQVTEIVSALFAAGKDL